MFLPWQTGSDADATEAVRGISTDQGQVVLVVSLLTIGLIQVGWRPAWIGPGFAVAIMVRAIRNLSENGPDPDSGLWVAVVASAMAAVLLIWNMFADLAARSGGDEDSGPTSKRGLSGPLGKKPSG